MSVLCPNCGRSYDDPLFRFGRTIHCTCGTRVHPPDRVDVMGNDGEPCFMVDAMLGRLARWLRILGYDTAYQADIDDGDLVRRALEEGRIILTRDRALPKEWWIDNYLLVEDSSPLNQVGQVVRQFNLDWQEGLFSRCTLCNESLKPVAPEQVADQLPAPIFARHQRFFQCPGCDRIYWQGSHVDRMRRELFKTLAKGKVSEEVSEQVGR